MPLDQKHLRFAHGYIELGMFEEANAELEKIDPFCWHLPEASIAGVAIYQALKKRDLMAVVVKKLVEWNPSESGRAKTRFFIRSSLGKLFLADQRFATASSAAIDVAQFPNSIRTMKSPVSVVMFAVSSLALASLDAQSLAPSTLPSYPLTPELLDRLLDLVARKGADYEAAAAVSNAVGFSAAGHAWRNRQVTTPDSQPDCIHSFAIDRGGEKDVAIVFRTPNDIKIYRTERNGKLVSALIYDLKTSQITMRDPVEAQAEVNAECLFWATAFRKADAE